MLSDGGGEVGSQSDYLGVAGKEVSNPGADGGGEGQVEQLVCEAVQDNCNKRQAIVHKEHPHIGASVLQMTQRSVCCYSDSILIIVAIITMKCSGKRKHNRPALKLWTGIFIVASTIFCQFSSTILVSQQPGHDLHLKNTYKSCFDCLK